jgi:hypothetical protein
MFGSLMMLASGVFAISPILEIVADGLALGEPLGELREDASGKRDVARLDDAAGCFRESLHDRQQRVGRERRRFVRERIDDLVVVHGGRGLAVPGEPWQSALRRVR